MFEKFSSKPGIGQRIATNLLSIEHNSLNCEDHGTDSWSQLVYLYTRMMLYNKVKYMSQQVAVSKSYNRKMKKLSNTDFFFCFLLNMFINVIVIFLYKYYHITIIIK